MRCVLQPGALLTEANLAKSHGLGRAGVRWALGRLSQDGLVTVIPRHGYVVAPIAIKRVNELFTIRQIIEPAAAELAASCVDVSEIHRLDGLCRQARYQIHDRESSQRFLELNTEFHVAIARATGNDWLVRILSSLLDESERMFHLGLMLRDRSEEMYHEHEDLVEALSRGDGKAAALIASTQIEAARQMVVSALVSSEDLADINVTASRRRPARRQGHRRVVSRVVV